MLELIFQGYIEWAYGQVLESWQYFSSALLDLMSLDFSYMKTHIPVLPNIMQVLLAVGWALLLGNLVFQAVRSMVSGLGFEGEDPKLLFARTFVFSFLLLASPQICEIGLDMTSRIMSALEMPDAVNVTLVDDSVFGGLTVSWLIVIIFNIILMFKVFGLLLEIVERYVVLAMLTITAPLAFAMGGSKSTSEIFTGWCRMYGSMCLLMALNVVFFKLLLSVVSTIPSGLDTLPWMALILAIVKVAKKADSIVTRIGLNPAITGDNLGSRLPSMLAYAVVRTMTSKVARAAGISAGGPRRDTSPGAPPGGSGPRSGGPFGGRSAAGTAAGTADGATHQSGQQSTSQHTAYQQGAAPQSGTAPLGAGPQPGGQQAAGGTATGAGVNVSGQAGQLGADPLQSRKSAVPPGTRRAPSHIKATAPGGSGLTSGKPGVGASVRNTARQEPAIHARDVSSRAAAVQPGTAGTVPGAAARFTQAAAPLAQGGTASGEVQAVKPSGQAAVKEHTSVPVPGTASAQRGQPGRGETRFTHRETSTGRGEQPQPISAQTPPASSGIQSGAAGTGAPRFSERPAGELRHGRNGSPGAPRPLGEQPRSSPARQEPCQASGGVTPPIRGTVSGVGSGTAGTAATGFRPPQAGRTAMKDAERAKPIPAGTGGKLAAPAAPAVRKEPSAPKSGMSAPKGSARPPREKRGTRHGQ